jgi:hypothetical protein
MRRIFIILCIAILYIFVVSLTLKFLPFGETPQFFKELFTKSWHGALVWIKIRQFAVAGVAGIALAFFLLRQFKKTAQVDGFAIGTLAVPWGIVFRLIMVGTSRVDWIEITDYLIVWLAIPLSVTILTRFEIRSHH